MIGLIVSALDRYMTSMIGMIGLIVSAEDRYMTSMIGMIGLVVSALEDKLALSHKNSNN